MIKNIYLKEEKEYFHKYYCDNCFTNIVVGDTMYGLELIFGKKDFQEWFEELKKEIKEE